MLQVTQYLSSLFPECMTTSGNNATQYPFLGSPLVRAQPPDNWYGNMAGRNLMGELPEVNGLMNLYVMIRLIGGPDFPNKIKFPTFSQVNLHFDEQNQRVRDLAAFQQENPNAPLSGQSQRTLKFIISSTGAQRREISSWK